LWDYDNPIENKLRNTISNKSDIEAEIEKKNQLKKKEQNIWPNVEGDRDKLIGSKTKKITSLNSQSIQCWMMKLKEKIVN
jgi:hypothetical protein